MPWLTINAQTKKSYLLDSITTIGRAEAANITIEDSTISRIHATIRQNARGEWVIFDGDLTTNKPSLNGVQIGARKLESREGQKLHNGDIITFSRRVWGIFVDPPIPRKHGEDSTFF